MRLISSASGRSGGRCLRWAASGGGLRLIGTLTAMLLSAAPAAAVPSAVQQAAATQAVRPEAPLPIDALLPGDMSVDLIRCTADATASPKVAQTATPAPPVAAEVVQLAHPWTNQPRLTGAGTETPARFFNRGRTLIFDAGAEMLYIDRDHRSFTYTADTGSAPLKWRGLCEAVRS